MPAALVAKAGFPSLEPYVTGPIGTTLSLSGGDQRHGRGASAASTSRGPRSTVAPLGWTKEPGTEGQAHDGLKLAAGGKLTTVDFDGRANGLGGKGTVRFAGDNAVQQVTLQQLKIGQTDVAVDWKRVPGGVELSMRGRVARIAARARHG